MYIIGTAITSMILMSYHLFHSIVGAYFMHVTVKELTTFNVPWNIIGNHILHYISLDFSFEIGL